MKKLFLTAVCLVVMAATSFAQDETVNQAGTDPQLDLHRKKPGGRGDDVPVAPVPEPGTMALASMGLIALGAAARQRRGK